MDAFWTYLGQVPWWGWILIGLSLVAIRDVLQRRHTISHNFPVVGHIRYMFESIGPEMRQYFVANNREELPIVNLIVFLKNFELIFCIFNLLLILISPN